MTTTSTTSDQEAQLQLLDTLITQYIQQERKDSNVHDVCSDESLKITKKWKDIEAQAKSHIQGNLIDREKSTHNESVSEVRQKISQIINSTKILGEAHQVARQRFVELNSKFGLLDDSAEYQALERYLRSIESDGKPTIDIFDKIKAAIKGLEPIQELAKLSPKDKDNVGRKQLREQLDQFVSKIQEILNKGIGSVALD